MFGWRGRAGHVASSEGHLSRAFQEDRPYEREFHGILKYEPVSRSHEGLVQVLHVGRNDGREFLLCDGAGRCRNPVREANSEIRIGVRPSARARISRFRPETYLPAALFVPNSPATSACSDGCCATRPPAGALAHLHAQGLVHRDIKPSNVIFVEGKPKLADIDS
jgi:serine/threonine protein kinase